MRALLLVPLLLLLACGSRSLAQGSDGEDNETVPDAETDTCPAPRPLRFQRCGTDLHRTPTCEDGDWICPAGFQLCNGS